MVKILKMGCLGQNYLINTFRVARILTFTSPLRNFKAKTICKYQFDDIVMYCFFDIQSKWTFLIPKKHDAYMRPTVFSISKGIAIYEVVLPYSNICIMMKLSSNVVSTAHKNILFVVIHLSTMDDGYLRHEEFLNTWF